MPLRLGVNIDHAATLRQARYARDPDSILVEPDPVEAARFRAGSSLSREAPSLSLSAAAGGGSPPRAAPSSPPLPSHAPLAILAKVSSATMQVTRSSAFIPATYFLASVAHFF